jgi:uncharacterized protein (DUF488 family)
MELLTIGHSNHEISTFIALLKKRQVTAIADVRSHPYSRFFPHFNQTALQKALAREKIHYVFLGRELGARPSNPECYLEGKAVYEKIAATEEFHDGIQRILKGLQTYNIALMCAEQDPLTCHRAILDCQYLRQFNVSIRHILKDGELETHDQLEQRMLAKHKLTKFAEDREQPIQLSLFTSADHNIPTRQECLEKAYQLQGAKIAYIEQGNDDDEQTNPVIHDRVYSKERAEVL